MKKIKFWLFLVLSIKLVSCDGTGEPKPEVEEFKVTFVMDGGSPVATAQTIIKNNRATMPEEPTKNGHTFLGWYLDGKLYSFDSIVNKDITLIAMWEEDV